MAVSKKGVFNFVGKLGNTVTYQRKGQWVRRTIGEITAEPTLKQLVGRQKMSLVTAFLAPVKEFVKISFEREAGTKPVSPYNVATSMTYKKAIKGIYPNQEIDFTKVVFSLGDMVVNDQVVVQTTDTGLEFTWDPSYLAEEVKSNDRIMIVAYCPEKKTAFAMPDGAKRKKGVQRISIPRYQGKVLIHTYAAFIAADRKNISDSVYLGEIYW